MAVITPKPGTIAHLAPGDRIARGKPPAEAATITIALRPGARVAITIADETPPVELLAARA